IRTIGSRRRSAASASTARMAFFSLTNRLSRAAAHSAGVATGGRFIGAPYHIVGKTNLFVVLPDYRVGSLGDDAHLWRHLRHRPSPRPRRRALGAPGDPRAAARPQALQRPPSGPAKCKPRRPLPATPRAGAGRAPPPRQAASTDPGTLPEVLWRGRALTDAEGAGEIKIEGDRRAAKRFLDLFALAGP